MKKPKTLSKEIVNILMQRVADEYSAFYHYKGASNWCAGVGFKVASSFFEKESKAELEHAQILEKFLVDWNVIVDLPPIAKPKVDYTSLVEVIEMSYDIEFKLYGEYEKDSVKILELGDVCAFDLLQPLRKVQTESVAEYSDMINMLEGVEPTKLNLLLLEEELFG
jgi:ferritin